MRILYTLKSGHQVEATISPDDHADLVRIVTEGCEAPAWLYFRTAEREISGGIRWEEVAAFDLIAAPERGRGGY